MSNTTYLDAFADLNPVPPDAVAALDAAPERERTYASILARRDDPDPVGDDRRLRFRLPRGRRGRALAVGLAVALVLPALAFSGEIGSLFGFSNEGTNVDETKLQLSTVSAAQTVEGTVKLLGSRAGTTFYAARGKNGGLCFFTGPRDPSDLRLSGGCWNREFASRFPSPAEPVLDMSVFTFKSRDSGENVLRLRGVAADGVAKMQVIGPECEVVHEAPVAGNVYATEELPPHPAVAIVGVDHDGNRVFTFRLRFWDESPCAARSGGS